MKKLFAWLLLCGIALSEVCFGQVSSAPPLLNFRGTTLPSACTVGRLFFKTDATAGNQVYACSSANTWTQILSSAGGGAGTLSSLAITGTTDSTSTTTGALTVAGGVGVAKSVHVGNYVHLHNGYSLRLGNATDSEFASIGFVGSGISINYPLTVTGDATINGLTVGRGAGNQATNAAFGLSALYSNTSGVNNVAIGVQAGYGTTGVNANTTGSSNVYIGQYTVGSANNNTNEIVIGANAVGNGSNTVTLGGSAVTATYLKGTVNIAGNILAGTDNTYDIGASAATRPRTGYFGTSVVTPTIVVNGVDVNAAWTAYTPTITCGSGVPTTITGSGRYKQVGKIINYSIVVTVTAAGTCATYIRATLPVASGLNVVAYGLEVSSNVAIVGRNVATTAVDLYKYDGTFRGLTGDTLLVQGTYEAP